MEAIRIVYAADKLSIEFGIRSNCGQMCLETPSHDASEDTSGGNSNNIKSRTERRNDAPSVNQIGESRENDGTNETVDYYEETTGSSEDEKTKTSCDSVEVSENYTSTTVSDSYNVETLDDTEYEASVTSHCYSSSINIENHDHEIEEYYEETTDYSEDKESELNDDYSTVESTEGTENYFSEVTKDRYRAETCSSDDEWTTSYNYTSGEEKGNDKISESGSECNSFKTKRYHNKKNTFHDFSTVDSWKYEPYKIKAKSDSQLFISENETRTHDSESTSQIDEFEDRTWTKNIRTGVISNQNSESEESIHTIISENTLFEELDLELSRECEISQEYRNHDVSFQEKMNKGRTDWSTDISSTIDNSSECKTNSSDSGKTSKLPQSHISVTERDVDTIAKVIVSDNSDYNTVPQEKIQKSNTSQTTVEQNYNFSRTTKQSPLLKQSNVRQGQVHSTPNNIHLIVRSILRGPRQPSKPRSHPLSNNRQLRISDIFRKL